MRIYLYCMHDGVIASCAYMYTSGNRLSGRDKFMCL